jgi:hypothetical protein
MRATVVCIALLLTACTINHASDKYACTKNTDCDPGRVCSDGFCVVSGSQVDASHIDAPRGGDGGQCPAGCTSCNVAQKTCTINCMLGSCNGQVTCPTGYKCDIQCNTDGSCKNGINCQNAASCNVECQSQNSCQNVQCGTGPCAINCAGQSSCKNVACGSSCACDVLCSGSSSCSSGIQCSSFACKSGLGCTSVPALCHSCQ